MLASIRPDSWNIPLFIHVFGAMVLVGGLVTTAAASFIGWNDESPALRQFAYKVLLFVALPGWILMRVAGEWLYRLQHWQDLPAQFDEPSWLSIGFVVADWGGLLFLVSLALGGVGLYRLRQGKGGAGPLQVTTVITIVLILAYAVAVWAMTGKPT